MTRIGTWIALLKVGRYFVTLSYDRLSFHFRSNWLAIRFLKSDVTTMYAATSI